MGSFKIYPNTVAHLLCIGDCEVGTRNRYAYLPLQHRRRRVEDQYEHAVPHHRQLRVEDQDEPVFPRRYRYFSDEGTLASMPCTVTTCATSTWLQRSRWIPRTPSISTNEHWGPGRIDRVCP